MDKKQVHSGEKDKIPCNECGKMCKNRMYLSDHIRKVHGKRKPCGECGAKFNEYNLSRHTRVVHGKEFHNCLCPVCGKCFFDQARLLSHKMEVHLKLKPFKCDVCDFKCATIRNLNLHRRKRHGSKDGLKLSDFNIKSLRSIVEEHEKNIIQ